MDVKITAAAAGAAVAALAAAPAAEATTDCVSAANGRVCIDVTAGTEKRTVTKVTFGFSGVNGRKLNVAPIGVSEGGRSLTAWNFASFDWYWNTANGFPYGYCNARDGGMTPINGSSPCGRWPDQGSFGSNRLRFRVLSYASDARTVVQQLDSAGVGIK